MMKKTIKKVLATVLSATMVMSMATVAFADNEGSITPGTGSVYYTNFTDVIVPTSFYIGMNPQELEVKMPDTTTSSAQVLAPKIGLVNTANRDKNVEVTFTPIATGSAVSDTAVEFVASKEDIGSKVDDLDIYLYVKPLASDGTVQLKSGSATNLQAITPTTISGAAEQLADVDATTTTKGAVSLTASGGSMTFNLAKATYALKTGAEINLTSDTANDMNSKFELATIPTGAATAFEITGEMNKNADWSKVGSNTKVKVTPRYKITDAIEEVTYEEGTANLVAGAVGTGYVSVKTISASKNSVTVTLPSGVNVTGVELVKSGTTTVVAMKKDTHYTLSGKVYTFTSSMLSQWSGAKITFKYSDGKSDVVTVQ